MSNPWITVGKKNKTIRKVGQLPNPAGQPKKAPGPTGEPEKRPKPARGPSKRSPKKASLLGIPAELRIKIWEDCLTPEETINVGLHYIIIDYGWND